MPKITIIGTTSVCDDIEGIAYQRPIAMASPLGSVIENDYRWNWDLGYYDYPNPPNPAVMAELDPLAANHPDVLAGNPPTYDNVYRTLKQPNRFGTYARFTQWNTLGTITTPFWYPQIVWNRLIMDHLTGIMYTGLLGTSNNNTQNNLLLNQLNNHNAAAYGGYSDWRVPAIGELEHLTNMQFNGGFSNRRYNYTWNQTTGTAYATCNVAAADRVQRMQGGQANFQTNATLEQGGAWYLICRTFEWDSPYPAI